MLLCVITHLEKNNSYSCTGIIWTYHFNCKQFRSVRLVWDTAERRQFRTCGGLGKLAVRLFIFNVGLLYI